MMDDQSNNQNAFDVNALIEKCLRGDQASYADLYNHFASGLYRLCYSLLLNKQDAEDIAQEAFVYAFKNLTRFNPDKASFKTWLYMIAVSRCRNTYRRKRLPQINLSQLFQLNVTAPKSESPEANLARSVAKDQLLTALATLKPQLREAIVLRYGHGLTYREIAEVMNCPAKTAESRVRLAHDKLRGLLQPVGHGLLEEILSF